MNISLPLDQMSVAEKLEAMEAIWSDLGRNPAAFETPAWHKTVLDERQAAIRAGKATYSDWAAARKRLRKKLAR